MLGDAAQALLAHDSDVVCEGFLRLTYMSNDDVWTRRTPVAGRAPGELFGRLHSNMLVLFTDEDARAVVGVVQLDECTLTLWPLTPYANLSKRLQPKNPIHISHKERPVFGMESEMLLYVSNGREKENWYHNLLRGTRLSKPSYLPADAIFRAKRRERYAPLAERLDEHAGVTVSGAWFNALAARLFWNFYSSPNFLRAVRGKIERKLAKVKRPRMVEKLELRHVAIGPNLPELQSACLRKMDADGGMHLEVGFDYHGGFHIIIEPEIRVLGMLIPVCMSLQVKRMRGDVLVYVPPPPSKRLWLGFLSQPLLELDVDTVFGKSYNLNVADVSALIADKIKAELANVMIFPEYVQCLFACCATRALNSRCCLSFAALPCAGWTTCRCRARTRPSATTIRPLPNSPRFTTKMKLLCSSTPIALPGTQRPPRPHPALQLPQARPARPMRRSAWRA